jgi:hypothetical protein
MLYEISLYFHPITMELRALDVVMESYLKSQGVSENQIQIHISNFKKEILDRVRNLAVKVAVSTLEPVQSNELCERLVQHAKLGLLKMPTQNEVFESHIYAAVDNEMRRYAAVQDSTDLMEALDLWRKRREEFPVLSVVARAVLGIGLSSYEEPCNRSFKADGMTRDMTSMLSFIKHNDSSLDLEQVPQLHPDDAAQWVETFLYPEFGINMNALSSLQVPIKNTSPSTQIELALSDVDVCSDADPITDLDRSFMELQSLDTECISVDEEAIIESSHFGMQLPVQQNSKLGMDYNTTNSNTTLSKPINLKYDHNATPEQANSKYYFSTSLAQQTREMEMEIEWTENDDMRLSLLRLDDTSFHDNDL